MIIRNLYGICTCYCGVKQDTVSTLFTLNQFAVLHPGHSGSSRSAEDSVWRRFINWCVNGVPAHGYLFSRPLLFKLPNKFHWSNCLIRLALTQMKSVTTDFNAVPPQSKFNENPLCHIGYKKDQQSSLCVILLMHSFYRAHQTSTKHKSEHYS